MNGLTAKLRSTPMIARVAPYIIFVALTALQGQFGEESKYWFYFAKSVVGVWLIWAVWPVVKEMRWTFSIEAVLVGVGVIVLAFPALMMLAMSGATPSDSGAWPPRACPCS